MWSMVLDWVVLPISTHQEIPDLFEVLNTG